MEGQIQPSIKGEADSIFIVILVLEPNHLEQSDISWSQRASVRPPISDDFSFTQGLRQIFDSLPC